MTKLDKLFVIACGAAVLMVGTATAQTLADAARAAQKNKRTPSATDKVITNDSLGFHAAPPDAGAKASRKNEAKADANPDKNDDAASAEDDKKKAAAELKTKFEKQQTELTQLQRELDVLQRENHLRGAVFYADAGARLRDEKKYAEDDRKYQADIANKQKAITDGKAALDKLREEARRTGVPVS